MITNGQFTAYRGPNFGSLLPYSSQVVISNTNKGEVHFINSGFWGPSNNIARVCQLSLVHKLINELLSRYIYVDIRQWDNTVLTVCF